MQNLSYGESLLILLVLQKYNHGLRKDNDFNQLIDANLAECDKNIVEAIKSCEYDFSNLGTQ